MSNIVKMRKRQLASLLLTIYVIFVAIAGLAIILFGGKDQFLRLNNSAVTSAIVLPIIIGNSGMIIRFLVKDKCNNDKVNTSSIFFSLGPLIGCIGLIGVLLWFRGHSIKNDLPYQISISQLNTSLALVMSILNLSTLYISSYLFQKGN